MKTLGLIGFPLSHSSSKKYFTEKFEKEGITGYHYELFPLTDISELSGLLANNPDIMGLNVTIPYKEKVLAYLDDIDPMAKKIGAVNCIKVLQRNGKRFLKGYNTDAYGFETSLKPLLKAHHKKALILGTGGASKAVEHVLKGLNIETQYVSRVARDNIMGYEAIGRDVMNEYKVIVNTTPLGMHPNTEAAPALPYELLTKDHVLYDLVYNPEATLFIRKGMEYGAVVKNGMEMLIGQAEKAWGIWTASKD